MDEGPAQMHYMPARFRSLAGGGWVTISSSDVRKSLMPMPGAGAGRRDESAVSGGAMKHEVKINLAHGDPDGERSCDLVHYKSSSNKLVCSPRAVDCCLDGLTAQELARVSHGCPSVKPELNVEVNGQRLTWGRVGRHGRNTLTDKSLEVRYGQTPTIVAVEPAEVRPGELITVYGRTCFGDVWKKDEDDGSSLRDDPDALRDLFSVEASAREDPRQEIDWKSLSTRCSSVAYRARFEIHLQTGTTDPNAAMVHTCANGTRSVVPLTGGFSAVYPKTSSPVFIYFITRRTPEVML